MIHSPLESGGLFWPWSVASRWPGVLAGAYGLAAGILLALAPVARAEEPDARGSA